MFRKLTFIFILAGVVFLTTTSNAYANVGLPMIFLGIPFLVLAFIPVFFIEMFIYHQTLYISRKRCAVGSFWANVLTTVVGYPISWILHVIVGMAVGYPIGYLFQKFHNIDWLGYAIFPLISAWLMPGVDQWMIYLAGMFGLIPAFWISVKLEGKLLQKLFKECPAVDIKKAVWKANRTTYLILAAFLGVMSMYHGLIKLHAFDFLRDRSDEQVAFSSPLQGEILVSSESGVYLLKLNDHKMKKVLSENFKEISRERFENVAMDERRIWFTIVDFGSGRQEKLYCYDLSNESLKEISSWKDISEITPVKDGTFIFSGESYYSNKERPKDEGIFRVTKDGTVQKVFNNGFTGSDEAGAISPSGTMIAELKMTGSKDLGIFNRGPFLIESELQVYNLNTGENIKIADLRGIATYKNVKGFEVSWHPDQDILYFSNTEFIGGVDAFLNETPWNKLKDQYGADDFAYNAETMEFLWKEFQSQVKIAVYEYNVQDKQTKRFVDGFDLLSWSPGGELVIVKIETEAFQIFNPKTNEAQMIRFEHFKKGKAPQLTWSKDGKFVAYLGDSEHFLDRHHYGEGIFWKNRPSWVWIKEQSSGKERKIDVKPINPARSILWRD